MRKKFSKIALFVLLISAFIPAIANAAPKLFFSDAGAYDDALSNGICHLTEAKCPDVLCIN